MKVIILSQIDYAGSAYKMFQAIKRHTDIQINLFSGPSENNLGHPIHNLVTDSNRAALQEIIDDADILHFKGDWPPVDGYLGLKIPDKPIILTTSGSFFRKKEHGGNCLSSTPFADEVFPDHPINCVKKGHGPVILREKAVGGVRLGEWHPLWQSERPCSGHGWS